MNENDETKSETILAALREHPLQSQILQLIPTQAQKGLSTSFNIDFTCVDADGHYIAIGTNIGTVYLFDRIKNSLSRLKNENRDSVTCVKIIISLECLVVFGCKNGSIYLFKIPLDCREEVEKFKVEGMHSSSVTAIEWVKNGQQFFSGDENGSVVCTSINDFEHQSRSRVLVNEKNKIVQLSYSPDYLVISTVFRSFIFSCEDNRCIKIGQKERKVFGPFGATFFCSCRPQQDAVVFVARPGQRIWKSDRSGVIRETMLFRAALSEPHPTIAILGDTDTRNDAGVGDHQFGKLAAFGDRHLLATSDSALVVIDPELGSVVASCTRLDPIVDVAATSDEIFVLRGQRHLVRISTDPDPYPCGKAPDEPSLIEEILVPLKGLTNFVKERSDSLSIQSEASLFDWLKKKRSVSSPPPVTDVGSKEGGAGGDALPQVVQLQPKDCTPIVVGGSPVDELPKIVLTSAIKSSEGEDIVYKPKKKHRKKVRFRSVSPRKKDGKPVNDDQEKDPSSLKSDTSSDALASETLDPSSLENSVPTSPDSDSNQASAMSDSTDSVTDTTANDVFFGSGDVSNVPDHVGDPDRKTQQMVIRIEGSGTLDVDLASGDGRLDVVDFGPGDRQTSYGGNQSSPPTSPDPDDIYTSFDGGHLGSRDSVLDSRPSPDSDSSESSSAVSSPEALVEPPKYGAEWLEFKAPEAVVDVCLSDRHVFCVDVGSQVFYSTYPVLGLVWKVVDQPAERIAVSPAEDVVWVLYKGTVYAAVQDSRRKWVDAEWVSVARNVVSIAVDSDCGWYVTSDGSLIKQPNLSPNQPCTYPESIPCDQNLVQVTSWNKVVWVLSTAGYLFSLQRNENNSKYILQRINLDGNIEIDSIFLGVQKTGWIVDTSGVIRFVLGVTPDSPEGVGKPWEVEASQYFVRNTNHLRKVVQKALKNDLLTSLIKGKQRICLSSSTSGVWFCKTQENLLYSNKKLLIGHGWDSVIPPGTASTTKWKLIAAGGVSSMEGSIWCLNSTGELFCLSLSSNTLLAVDLPANEVGDLMPTGQHLWLLSTDGRVFVRRGITLNTPQGVWWQALDLTQLSSEVFVHVSCAFEIAWACTSVGRVFFRLGSLCPSSERRLAQAWIPVSSGPEEHASPIMDRLSAIGKKFPLPLVNPANCETVLCKVYAGPQGLPVWALDTRGSVYVREGVTISLPVGKAWTLVPELQAKELCVSKSAVWLLKASGKVYRRFGVSERNPCGDYWKQIPGCVDHLSVTEDDDLWAIKHDGLFQHLSYVLNFSANDDKKVPARSISEEDWEDIMADGSDFES